MKFFISDRCVGCGACAGACHGRCISRTNGKMVIDESRCLSCGSCMTVCAQEAILAVGDTYRHEAHDPIQLDADIVVAGSGGAPGGAPGAPGGAPGGPGGAKSNWNAKYLKHAVIYASDKVKKGAMHVITGAGNEAVVGAMACVAYPEEAMFAIPALKKEFPVCYLDMGSENKGGDQTK